MTPDSTGIGFASNAKDEAMRTLRTLKSGGFGAVSMLLLSLGASQYHGLIAAVGIGTLICLSAGAVGAALGFLFALPRVLSKDPKEEVSTANASQDETKKRVLSSNTNLERVSDWLTTMIVGVGLTQLSQVVGALYRFRLFIAETARVFPDGAKGNAGTLPIVCPMLLIFGLIAGFVVFYLFTRLKMSALFQQVEEDLNRLPSASAAAVRQTATEASASGSDESPAIRAVLNSAQPSVDESLDLMYSLLYRPQGYQRVIDLGGQLSKTVATKRPEYWFYLAAAFGQKHHSLLANNTSEGERQSAKDNAFDCARRAVALDASYKRRLWNISDPESTDDDLADFRDDADFKEIVGVKDRKT